MDKSEAISILRDLKEHISVLRTLSMKSPEFAKWHRDTEIAIEKIFGKDSRNIKDFNSVRYHLSVVSSSTTEARFQGRYVEGLNEAGAILESMIDELIKYGDEPKSKTEGLPKEQQLSNEVFIVHGKDEAMKQSVARLLERLDLKPIILHEKANEGKTIIQKFIDYSNVSFAIVLLSPDDIAYPKDKTSKDSKFRARQNVILELGFFLGKLGMKHVTTLFRETENFEIPTDYSGVIYTPFDDSGLWQFKLGKELKACGFDIDLNKI